MHMENSTDKHDAINYGAVNGNIQTSELLSELLSAMYRNSRWKRWVRLLTGEEAVCSKLSIVIGPQSCTSHQQHANNKNKTSIAIHNVPCKLQLTYPGVYGITELQKKSMQDTWSTINRSWLSFPMIKPRLNCPTT